MRRVFTLLLFLLSLITAFCAARSLYLTHLAYREADNYYTGIQDSFVTSTESHYRSTPPAEQEASTPRRFCREAPPITVDFEELKAINPDIVGWIYCEDTPISYPVLQGSSNDTYIHRRPDGGTAVSGSIFLDAACLRDFSSSNSVLYGHHMKDGSMFAGLDKFKHKDFVAAHPVMWLLTSAQNYRVDLFAGLITPAGGWVYDSEPNMQVFLQKVSDASVFCADSIPEESDQILTLSTCDYSYQGARFVVMGIMTLSLPQPPEPTICE